MRASDGQTEPVRIGVSQCLLGDRVRYDGGHKDNDYVRGTLGRYLELVPLCPEVAIGLGVPRLPIQLIHTGGTLRVRGVTDPTVDVTDQLAAEAARVAAENASLCGYVFKSRSPSCGIRSVPVQDAWGRTMPDGTGRYAAGILEQLPWLPVIEESDLADPAAQDHFLTRIYTCHRWHGLMRQGLTAARLVAFHSRHKYLVQAHNEKRYRSLGRLVAEAGCRPVAELAASYRNELMAALACPASRQSHVNVLQHLAGHLKIALEVTEKKSINQAIERYRDGQVDRSAPIDQLRRHLPRGAASWAAQQVYLAPYPDALRPTPSPTPSAETP